MTIGMKTTLGIAALFAAASCVPMKKFEKKTAALKECKTNNTNVMAQNVSLQKQLAAKNKMIDSITHAHAGGITFSIGAMTEEDSIVFAQSNPGVNQDDLELVDPRVQKNITELSVYPQEGAAPFKAFIGYKIEKNKKGKLDALLPLPGQITQDVSVSVSSFDKTGNKKTGNKGDAIHQASITGNGVDITFFPAGQDSVQTMDMLSPDKPSRNIHLSQFLTVFGEVTGNDFSGMKMEDILEAKTQSGIKYKK